MLIEFAHSSVAKQESEEARAVKAISVVFMVVELRAVLVWPNVRAKLPAEACSVSLVCEGAEGAAHQAYAACRSGSA